MSKVYVTGARNWQKVEELAFQLRERGKLTVTPGDTVDADHDEQSALIERLKALLGCDAVVTTSPNDGEWGPATKHEIAVAREANIPVIPAMRALEVTT